jgi:uncharacterized membrane protein
MPNTRTHCRKHNALRYATIITAACVLLLPAISVQTAAAHAGTTRPPAFSIRSLGYLSAGTQSFPTGINARGDVSGYGDTYRAHYPRYSRPDVAFVFTQGKLVKLGLPPGSQESFAQGLNDKG